mmetsp:Transcript_43595/g.79423  ORF Transcript_43595/g.79423 Transcript_43595/m.79423 type:complete len:275 (+) Transcript_43595:718-1542(+)
MLWYTNDNSNVGKMSAPLDQSAMPTSWVTSPAGAAKETRTKKERTTTNAKALLTWSNQSVPFAANTKPPKIAAKRAGPGMGRALNAGSRFSSSSPPLERYAINKAKCRNAKAKELSKAPFDPMVLAAIDCKDVVVTSEDAIVDKDTSAISKPVVAMYTQQKKRTTVEGMKPACCVTAGKARTPAPTVVPAMRTMALSTDGSLYSTFAPATTSSQLTVENNRLPTALDGSANTACSTFPEYVLQSFELSIRPEGNELFTPSVTSWIVAVEAAWPT